MICQWLFLRGGIKASQQHNKELCKSGELGQVHITGLQRKTYRHLVGNALSCKIAFRQDNNPVLSLQMEKQKSYFIQFVTAFTWRKQGNNRGLENSSIGLIKMTLRWKQRTQLEIYKDHNVEKQ
jgi:hypothetical protein